MAGADLQHQRHSLGFDACGVNALALLHQQEQGEPTTEALLSKAISDLLLRTTRLRISQFFGTKWLKRNTYSLAASRRNELSS
jgi:hypothetical protein